MAPKCCPLALLFLLYIYSQVWSSFHGFQVHFLKECLPKEAGFPDAYSFTQRSSHHLKLYSVWFSEQSPSSHYAPGFVLDAEDAEVNDKKVSHPPGTYSLSGKVLNR